MSEGAGGVHVGVDAGSGFIETIKVTAANVHEINVTIDLIREYDEVVYSDFGYLGIEERGELQRDRHLCAID